MIWVTFLKSGYKLEIFKNLKLNKMKKLLVVFTAAAFLTACNGNSTKTETNSDSTTVNSTVDTTNAMSTDTTTHAMGDSTHATTTDSTKK
jgi:uncharacterized lipoprotein YajG